MILLIWVFYMAALVALDAWNVNIYHDTLYFADSLLLVAQPSASDTVWNKYAA